MTGEKTFWKGDRAEYTGRSEMCFGALFWELKLLEGHRKGDLVLTNRVPKFARPEPMRRPDR